MVGTPMATASRWILVRASKVNPLPKLNPPRAPPTTANVTFFHTPWSASTIPIVALTNSSDTLDQATPAKDSRDEIELLTMYQTLSAIGQFSATRVNAEAWKIPGMSTTGRLP